MGFVILGHWQPTGSREGRGPFPRSTLDVDELHQPTSRIQGAVRLHL